MERLTYRDLSGKPKLKDGVTIQTLTEYVCNIEERMEYNYTYNHGFQCWINTSPKIVSKSVRDVYNDYLVYCKELNHPELSKTAFGHQLSCRGIKSQPKTIDKCSVRVYI